MTPSKEEKKQNLEKLILEVEELARALSMKRYELKHKLNQYYSSD